MEKEKKKISESSKKAKAKWKAANTYQTTVTFNKNKFPVEKFEKAKEEINKIGMSLNEFLVSKLKEMSGGD